MSRRAGKPSRGAQVLLAPALALAALVCLLPLANAAFARFVEGRAEAALQARLGSPVMVDLSGFPVTPRLLTGSLPEAEVTVREIGLPGSRLSLGRLDVTLTDVRYEGERKGLLDPPLEAREVRFESRLSGQQVSGLAGALPGVKGAEPRDDGLRLLLVGGAEVDARLVAEEGGLVLRPDTPVLDTEVPLTPGGLPGGASIEEVNVGGDAVIIRGRANDFGV